MWKEFQSSKHKNATDCVVRALMVLTGKNWKECFSMLCNTCIDMQRMPNEMPVITKVLKNLKFTPYKAEMIRLNENHKRRQTVKEFAKSHKNGNYFVSVSGHVVAVKNGNWYDSWDSGDYKVFKFWKAD